MAHDSPLSERPYTDILRPLGGMAEKSTRGRPFNPATFLIPASDGGATLRCQKDQILFVHGDEANAVFYIVEGWVKLTVVSAQGKEAGVAMLESGDFFGEACLAEPRVYMSTATSLDASTVVRIDRTTMTRVLRIEPGFSELFLSHLVTRNVRTQEDLVDQLFNSAEKRLARTLLLLAHFGREDTPVPIIPKISQETLAEMIGTTRSRVSFFMNRFKKRGFIKYNAGLHVHRSLLNVVLTS
jgi:CRP/FNR family cyclic AMP-dependent transcriptional regulator